MLIPVRNKQNVHFTQCVSSKISISGQKCYVDFLIFLPGILNLFAGKIKYEKSLLCDCVLKLDNSWVQSIVRSSQM